MSKAVIGASVLDPALTRRDQGAVEFLSLRGALPDFLKPVITIAYYTGLRRGEILDLTWDRVDMASRRIFLDPGTTKNNESRIVYMTDDLLRVLTAWKRFHDWVVPHYPLV